ncbi:hypothetical protein ONZ45_g7594 [Pleurotus djamor]|nr:hypothetical protein ONZ45_g7594 [Pleurotus djamor]
MHSFQIPSFSSPNFESFGYLSTIWQTTINMSFQSIDFRKLDLPIGLIEPKFSFSSTLLLLYRCRFIILFFSLWATFVYYCFTDIITWDVCNYLGVTVYPITYFLTLLLARLYDCYHRVDKSINAWRVISKSLASFADSVYHDTHPENGDDIQELDNVLRSWGELVVALGLYDPNPKPQHRIGRNDHKDHKEEEALLPHPSSSTAPQESQIPPSPPPSPQPEYLYDVVESTLSNVLTRIYFHLRPYIPNIPLPKDADTPRGFRADEVWITASERLLTELGSRNFRMQMKMRRRARVDDVISVAAFEVFLFLFIFFMQMHYPYVDLHRHVLFFVALLGITEWKCIPITIVAASLFFAVLVAADDYDHMMTKCNKPCGYTSAHQDPFIEIFCLIIDTYETGFNNFRAEIREAASEGYFDVNCPEFLGYQAVDYVVMELPKCLVSGRWRRKSVRRERERERRRREREGDVFEGEEGLGLGNLFWMA